MGRCPKAWLLDQTEWTQGDYHMQCCSLSEDDRTQGRRALEGVQGSQALFDGERELREGEPEEPPGEWST